jgi:hypothetical protein
VTDWAKKAAVIERLDRRRAALDQVLWQALAIIVAAQAFLLPVLAREGLAITSRAFILVAGVAASLTAIVGLRRGRRQELFFNEEIRGLFGHEGVTSLDYRRGRAYRCSFSGLELSRPSASPTCSR